MRDEIRIRRIEGTWVVRAAGAVIGETVNALEAREGDRPAVIYFPRDDLAMAFLDRSDTGGAQPVRYAIIAKSGTIADAAWSYEAPGSERERLAGHIAFDPAKATVERI